MGNRKFDQALLAAVAKSMFNSSEWTPKGDPFTLEELWDVTNPGLYKEIKGDTAEVTATTFADGQVGLRITVPFKNGTNLDLKLSGRSTLEEGDIVSIESIKAQLLSKVGQDDIMRYDAEAVEA